MNVFTFPLRYLWLKDEDGWPLALRDWLGVLVLALVLSLPFWLPNSNYFGAGGFLDRFGSFSGVLTGFYVAALVAVASFVGTNSTLDDPIEVGSVFERTSDEGEPLKLTRRQYVCVMFGYLSFISLFLSLGAILFVVISGVASPAIDQWTKTSLATTIAGNVVMFVINLVLAHMVATTCHGLYYLIDRVYAQKAILLTKEGKPDGS